jgi:hypothetical protein
MSVEFKKYEQEEWECLVVKSLPEDFPLESLIHRADISIGYEAFKHKKDKLYAYEPLDRDVWNIGFTHRSGVPDLNKLIIRSLEYGAQFLNIQWNDSYNPQEVFNDVKLEMVAVLINTLQTSTAGIQRLQNFLFDYQTNNKVEIQTRLVVANPLVITSDRIKYIHTSQTYSERPDSIKKSLEKFCHYVHQACISEFTSDEIHVEFAIGKHFYTEIARLRSARIMGANLLHMNQKQDVKIIYHATLHPEIFDYSPDESLIAQCYAIMSAILGGADVVYGLPWSHEDVEYARLSQNIQNILLHETHLDYYKDAVNGSYFLEDLTKQMTTLSWAQWVKSVRGPVKFTP